MHASRMSFFAAYVAFRGRNVPRRAHRGSGRVDIGEATRRDLPGSPRSTTGDGRVAVVFESRFRGGGEGECVKKGVEVASDEG